MIEMLERVNAFVWGLPALILILGVGICLTIRTRCAQLRLLPRALLSFLRPVFAGSDHIDRSKNRALCTALAATVGTGNLAGVAGAIALGGPGAVFWMWICAYFGMVTKMAEASLAIQYRRRDDEGTYDGGPMYMIVGAMKKNWHWLAYIYCFFGVVASFGVGNATQVNTVVGGVYGALPDIAANQSFMIDLVVGVIIAILIFAVMSGGAAGIGAAAEKLVPLAAVTYIALCLGALAARYDQIPGAFRLIITGAFNPRAVTGGVVGSFFVCLRIGAARGVFTNEAGMGTASMAHATSAVSEPVEQGMMGIVEVFIDTVVICTLTALVILCSGVDIPYGSDTGIQLTTRAFVSIYGQWSAVLISVCLCLFAFATVIGWGLYGLQCARFLFGRGCARTFILLQACMAVIAAFMKTKTLWLAAEIVNGLMSIPNLIVLAYLMPQLTKLLSDYEHKDRIKRKSGFLTKQVYQ